MSNTQQMDPDAPGAQTMNTMMMTMPLVSVFFCFTFPAAIGIYWVVQGAFQIVQQLAVNSYMNKVDMDELIQKNVDKMNKKRAKKGLPPAKVNQNASANLKNIQAQTEKEEQLRNEKLSKIDRQVKNQRSSIIQIRSLEVLLPKQKWCRSIMRSTTSRRGAVWIWLQLPQKQ